MSEFVRKYRDYLSDADSLAEAQSMAPEGKEVQVGDGGGFYVEIDPENAAHDNPEAARLVDAVEGGSLPPEARAGDISLGPNEQLEPVEDVTQLDAGDVIQFEGPQGDSKFGVVDESDTEGLFDAVRLRDTAYTPTENRIEGEVVEGNPASEYETDSEFASKVAAAVEQGWFGNTADEEMYFNVSDLQHGIPKIDNSELLLDALEAEREGRNSRAVRDHIESRLSALGEEVPEELLGPVPTEVPRKREGTDFERVTREGAVTSLGFLMDASERHLGSLSEWNDYLDTLTQDELRAGVERYLFQEIDDTAYSLPNSPLDYEGENFHEESRGDTDEVIERDFYVDTRSLAPMLSRMDHETVSDLFGELESLPGYDSDEDIHQTTVERFYKSAANYAHDPYSRYVAYNDHLLPMQDKGSEWKIKESYGWQFEDDYGRFVDDFLGEWTGFNDALYHAAPVLDGMFANDNDSPIVYVEGMPVDSIDPSMEQKENFRKMRNETRRYYKRQLAQSEEDYVRAWRGVDSDVTSHSTTDSYSTSFDAAESFDSGRLIEAELEPRDILASKEAAEALGWPASPGFPNEEEAIVMGGGFGPTGETGGDRFGTS